MVVEIEGVQKIIRRIRENLYEADQSLKDPESLDRSVFSNLIYEIQDDCYRVVSLVLAETGHWQPSHFSDSLEMAAQELAIQMSDVPSIATIPPLAEQLIALSEITGAEREKFCDFQFTVKLLCKNLSDYIIHTELPI